MRLCPDCSAVLEDTLDCVACGWHSPAPSPEQHEAEAVPSNEPAQPATPPNPPTQEYPSSTANREAVEPEPDEKLPHSQTVVTPSGPEEVNVVQGSNITFKKEINNYYDEFKKGKEEEEVRERHLSFIEASEPFSPRHGLLKEAYPLGFDLNLSSLRESHLILLSCFDEELALDAAHLLIDGLATHAVEARRLLLFERLAPDRLDPSIHSFSFDQKAVDKTGVIIEATSKRAETFVDSLLIASPTLADKISEELKGSNLFLVCLLEPARIDRWVNDGGKVRFAHWRVPYTALSSPEAELDFEKLYDEGDPVSKTVLYTATFFPELTRSDFNRVVGWLLRHDEAAAFTGHAKTTLHRAEGESPEAPSGEREKMPLQLWQNDPDTYVKRLQLRRLSHKISRKVIGFSPATAQEKIAERWAEELFFDLDNRHTAVRELGLLFDSSDAVAKNARTLITEGSASEPDDYDMSWLVSILGYLNNRPRNTSKLATADASYIRDVELLGRAGAGKPSNHLYARLADLMREIFGYPQLKQIATGVLEQLMREGSHQSVLALVRRLQYALNFDEFYWLKQLLDRGVGDVRTRTKFYLYGYLKNADNNIYEILDRLKAWLPPEDREPSAYSPSNQAALEVFLDYCVATIREFKEDLYGLWPSQYPLFDFNDPDTAKANLSLLAEWLCHPGTRAVVREKGYSNSSDELLAAFITHWLFILRGVTETADALATSPAAEVNPGSSVRAKVTLDADTVLVILLEQIILRTDPPLQKRLIAYWAVVKADFNLILDNFTTVGSLRKSILWQRRLVGQLIEKFKAEMRRLKEQQDTQS
jgi:hypothetical protein